MKWQLTANALLALSLTGLFVGCESTGEAVPEPSSPYYDSDDVYVPPSDDGVREEPAPTRMSGWPTRRSNASMSCSSMAYPTGNANTSAVGIEKCVPTSVRVNEPFQYEIIVTNLTNVELTDVSVTDQPGSNMRITGASPAMMGTNSWALGNLDPKETRVITVNAVATAEGTVGSCATVAYNSLLCATIPVVRPALELVKTGPAEVLRCEEIVYRFTVTNSGTGAVSGVTINDPLPNGLTTTDGGSNITFNVGTLAEGQSKDYTARVQASSVGSYTNRATASGDGLTAESGTVNTVVKAPALKITKTGETREYVKGQTEYTITVTNTGNGVARDAKIVDRVPSGATFVSASDGGTLSGGAVTWNVGNLQPNATKTVKVTFTMGTLGTMRNVATAEAYCAEAVSATAETEYRGIPAILLEVIDINDPTQVGETETYVITVTNQGSANGTNIAINCSLEAAQQYVSSEGATQATTTGSNITFAPLPSLAPGAKATWRVTVRAVQAGDIRFKVVMREDQLGRTVEETEATNQYQ